MDSLTFCFMICLVAFHVLAASSNEPKRSVQTPRVQEARTEPRPQGDEVHFDDQQSLFDLYGLRALDQVWITSGLKRFEPVTSARYKFMTTRHRGVSREYSADLDYLHGNGVLKPRPPL